MREIRNTFLQQRIFYTEARQGQKILGKNRASLFQGRHLLAEGYWGLKDSASTQRTLEQWKTKNRSMEMNKCFIVSWELYILCCWQMQLEFCRAFVSACFPYGNALHRWSTNQECPRLPPHPWRGWSCLGGWGSAPVQEPKSRFCETRTYLPWFADVRQGTVWPGSFQRD